MPFLLPFPKKAAYDGESVLLPPAIEADAVLLPAADALGGYIKRLFELDVKKDGGSIRLMLDRSLNEEAYTLTVSRDGALIAASTVCGAAHGCSALLSLAKKDGAMLSLPVCKIQDAPDAGFRSLMVDVARAFRTVDEIKRYIDLCFFTRLNTLHLHLADGPHFSMYRLPSKAFPDLTKDGAYTEEDIAEIVSYAAARGITILPEIEMPSHADPLTSHYPDVFGSHAGGLICPGKDGVFDALDTLIGEVCELFPASPYVHVGCDEAAYEAWDNCEDCRAYMRSHGIAGAAALYTHIVDRVTRMVLAHGRKPIVWEGFPKEGTEMLSRDITVMVFQSTYQTAPSLTSQGFHVINTSWQPLYIVPSRPKYWERDALYDFRVNKWLFEDAADDSEAMYVTDTDKLCGSEMCVWESASFDADSTILSRTLPVFAERLWNAEGKETFEEVEAAADALHDKTERLRTRA